MVVLGMTVSKISQVFLSFFFSLYLKNIWPKVMENLDWKNARGNEKEERGISKVDSVVHNDYFI